MPARAHRDTLEGSWEWLEFAARLPSRPQPIKAQSASTLALSGRCIVTGLSFLNLATTAGMVDLYDGQDANGTLAWRTPAAASAITVSPIPPNGIFCEIGAFLNLTTVTITGAILIIPLWHYRWTPPGE